MTYYIQHCGKWPPTHGYFNLCKHLSVCNKKNI